MAGTRRPAVPGEPPESPGSGGPAIPPPAGRRPGYSEPGPFRFIRLIRLIRGPGGSEINT